jgi:hypothetical protein
MNSSYWHFSYECRSSWKRQTDFNRQEACVPCTSTAHTTSLSGTRSAGSEGGRIGLCTPLAGGRPTSPGAWPLSSHISRLEEGRESGYARLDGVDLPPMAVNQPGSWRQKAKDWSCTDLAELDVDRGRRNLGPEKQLTESGSNERRADALGRDCIQSSLQMKPRLLPLMRRRSG